MTKRHAPEEAEEDEPLFDVWTTPTEAAKMHAARAKKPPYSFEPLKNLPPHNHTLTSIAAAESKRTSAATDRAVVFEAIKSAGGLTCDQVEAATGLSHQNASARIWQLQGNQGQPRRICDSGARRKTRSGRMAIVWQVVPWSEPPTAAPERADST